MFSETDGSRKAIGDVDVVWHDGLYHLFHLVLPNHDFIAHAVSTDGINWRRVRNALFIGDPGAWDDLMLWTMHVTADPHRPGFWRMFYTGLSRRDKGGIQRLGMAVSHDLYRWRKVPVNWIDGRGPEDPNPVKKARLESQRRGGDEIHAEFDAGSCWPLTPDPEHYESSLDEGRHWVSFRDPFFYCEGPGEPGWLLAAGRVKEGPVVRRGCVAAMKEVGPGHFAGRPPLHHPGLYDDIEVPNLLKIEGEYYLIGSLREDAKIRYWHASQIGRPWRSYADNVLMAKGNYAGRICQDDHGYLVWNFYSADLSDRQRDNLMPPPKRVRRLPDGRLKLTTFEAFEPLAREAIDVGCVHALRVGAAGHPSDQETCAPDGDRLVVESEAGFQAFVFGEELGCFRFTATMRLDGPGKCGLVFRVHPDRHDGYYLSLDLIKGVAQLRTWDTGPDGGGEDVMQFRSLQSGFWYAPKPGEAEVKLLAFGSYIELSVDGCVLLSLADQTFSAGLMGVYLESAKLELTNVRLNRMESPVQSDEHLTRG